MKPILYSSTATSFNNQGLGVLSDAVSCTVVEERNGEYELTLQYPVGGIHYSEIEDRAIIMAIPSPYRSAQPFRIYSIESPLNGIVTIHAHHISYDLSGIPVSPFTAGTCKAALSGLVTNSAVTNPFSADTDKLVTGTYTLKVPTSFRACLGGQEGSILDVYGKGEYEFDKFDIYLHLNRGSDNGVKFAYGVNITDFNMERNLESIVTGIYPYWANVDGDELVELDEKIIEIYDPNNPTYFLEAGGAYLTDANGNYLTTQTPFSFHNVLPLDLSSEFEEAPTQEQLKERAEKYITDNGLGAPKVSIEVSFVHLGQTEEYAYLKEVEKCDLCDTVTVEFPLYGISVKAKIIAIETDVLLERYNSVQIGDPRSTIADTIAGLTLTSATKTEVQAGNQKAADIINNTEGTFQFIDNGDGTNGGFTIYETEDGNSWLKCTAGGLGISADGGLTYNNAITKNGVTASELHVIRNGVEVMTADESSSGFPELVMRDYDNDVLFTLSPYEIAEGVTGTNIGVRFVVNDADGNKLLQIGTDGDSSTGDITEMGLKLFDPSDASQLAFIGYDNTTKSTLFYVNHADYPYKEFSLSSGYYNLNGEIMDDSWRTIFNLDSPEDGSNLVLISAGAYTSPVSQTRSKQGLVSVRSGASSASGLAFASMTASEYSAGSDASIAVYADGGGRIGISCSTVGRPSITVRDETSNVDKTLVLTPITISGTTYYVMAGT